MLFVLNIDGLIVIHINLIDQINKWVIHIVPYYQITDWVVIEFANLIKLLLLLLLFMSCSG